MEEILENLGFVETVKERFKREKVSLRMACLISSRNGVCDVCMFSSINSSIKCNYIYIIYNYIALL